MPLAYLCDNPMEYGKHPEVMKYLSKAPTVWDESVPLDGRVGQYALMAKRTGNAWFVGGMTNDDGRTLTVDFSFLPENSSYSARIYKDDGAVTNADAKAMLIEDLTVTPETRLSVECSNEGGLVIQLYEAGSADDPDVVTAVAKTSAPEKRTVTVYHSAGGESITIKSDDNIRAATVVNMQGSVVATQKFAGNAVQEAVSVAHLPAGIYIVSVETESGAYATKLFKE